MNSVNDFAHQESLVTQWLDRPAGALVTCDQTFFFPCKDERGKERPPFPAVVVGREGVALS